MGIFNSNTEVATKANVKKTFWGTRAGKFSAWGMAFIAIIALLGIKAILPWAISFATDALHAGLLFSGIAAVGFIATRKRVHTMVWYSYKAVMTWISNGFRNKNYMNIMSSYLDKSQERLFVISDEVKLVSREKGKLEREVEELEEQLEGLMSKGIFARNKAKELDAAGKKDLANDMNIQAGNAASQIGDIGRSLKKLKTMLVRMELTYAMLYKIKGYVSTLVVRLESKVKVAMREYETLSSAHNVISNAWNLVHGRDDERELFNMSMEHVAKLTGEKIGDMEMMMDDLDAIIRDQYLDSMLMEESGFKALDAWEQKHALKLEDDFSFLNEGDVDKILSGNLEEFNKLRAIKKEESVEQKELQKEATEEPE